MYLHFNLLSGQWWLLTLNHSDDMDILQKDRSKTLIPARKRTSNIVHPFIWSHHRPLGSMTKLKGRSREINLLPGSQNRALEIKTLWQIRPRVVDSLEHHHAPTLDWHVVQDRSLSIMWVRCLNLTIWESSTALKMYFTFHSKMEGVFLLIQSLSINAFCHRQQYPCCSSCSSQVVFPATSSASTDIKHINITRWKNIQIFFSRPRIKVSPLGLVAGGVLLLWFQPPVLTIVRFFATFILMKIIWSSLHCDL